MSLRITSSGGAGGVVERREEDKWLVPGWRIEQKYAPGVLVGNWAEQRRGKFPRGEWCGSTTSRDSYTHYPPSSYRPDPTTRYNGLLRNYGLDRAHLLVHHGNRYLHNTHISSYDQHFCRAHPRQTHSSRDRSSRDRSSRDLSCRSSVGLCGGQSVQVCRQWDRHQLSWLPEALDLPVTGPPTMFGLKEAVDERRKRREEEERKEEHDSTYTTSYRSPPPSSFPPPRHATPHLLSSHLHPHRTLHHLQLRGKPLVINPETVEPSLLASRPQILATE